MNVHRLGPRATLLLGLLDAPLTAEEIAYRIGRAFDSGLVDELLDDLEPVFGSPRVALRSLSDEGEVGIRRQLARLEDAGLAAHVDVGQREQSLFYRLPLG